MSAHATAAGTTADPWLDQRARVGRLETLVRVIDLAADRQEFLILKPKNADDLRDLGWNGETVILPPAPRSRREVAEIVADYDARYWADPKNKQTRISALDREPYLKP